MYVKDHPPPHFHGVYAEHEALLAIASGDVVEGGLPNLAKKLVEEWTLLRQTQLIDNWRRAGAAEQLERIPGLDAD